MTSDVRVVILSESEGDCGRSIGCGLSGDCCKGVLGTSVWATEVIGELRGKKDCWFSLLRCLRSLSSLSRSICACFAAFSRSISVCSVVVGSLSV